MTRKKKNITCFIIGMVEINLNTVTVVNLNPLASTPNLADFTISKI